MAFVDAGDSFHEASVSLLTAHRGPLIVPVLVVGEVAFLARKTLGTRAEVAFLREIARGVFSIAVPGAGDWLRTAELVARYADLPLGTGRACVVATAERLGITSVATTDRRHFSVVRPAHADRWELPLLD